MNRLESFFKSALLFLMGSLIFASCCRESCYKEPGLFSGFVKGAVICKATDRNHGLLEFHDGPDHDNSFMVIYRNDPNKTYELNDEVYFEVERIKGIDIAKNIQTDAPATIVTGGSTSFRYHCFSDGGAFDFIHVRGHIINRASLQSDGTTYSVNIDGYSTPFTGDFRINAIINSIMDRYEAMPQPKADKQAIYFEATPDREVIDISLCHYHNGRKIEGQCKAIGEQHSN